MRQHYPAFRELGAEILVLSTVGLEALAAFAQELALPFPVLSDSGARVYQAYGLGRGLSVGRRTPFEFLRLLWQAGRLYRPVGDVMQIGGDFVVDDQGIVRYAHGTDDPTDRPAVPDLLRTISEVSSD